MNILGKGQTMNKKRNIIMLSITAVALIFSMCVGASSVSLVRRNENIDGADGDEDFDVMSEQTANNYFRLLVAGKDRASGLYDVMMLVSLNRDDNSIFVLQIPRDTYLEYTEKSYKKINGAPASLGGMKNFVSFLSENIGVEIDSYVSFGLDAFSGAIDAIGGVEIELEEELNYSDPAQDLNIHLPKGKQILDGRTAEHFVRYRAGYLRGDLDRLDAQKLFMSALFKKVMSLSLYETTGLITELLPSVNTDLGLFEIISVIKDARSVSPEKLSFVTAPGEDIVSERSGAWYYVVSAQSLKQILGEYFGSEKEFDPQGLFLNENDGGFTRIYKSSAQIQISNADNIGKNQSKSDK